MQEKLNPWMLTHRQKGVPVPADATPALAEGTAGIKLADRAEKAAAANPEALEPRACGEAECRREKPLQTEARREGDTPPREGERELIALPPEGWRKPEELP